MPTINDAKIMARAMESALRARNIVLSHSECLHIVARQFGLKDWNVFSALAKRYEETSRRRASQLKGWAFLAEHPEVYDHGAATDPEVTDGRTALIRFDPIPGQRRYPDLSRAFGCYMQMVSAVPFHGKRVAIEARLCCHDVTHGATAWARIDGMPGQTLAFDNLKDVGEGWLFGSEPWTVRRIVMDVPVDAISLNYGFFLKGKGSLWASAFYIGEAATPVQPTSSILQKRSYTPAWLGPTNLEFAEVIDFPEVMS